jgi:S-adenosylmethionine-diacylglycerol 3-amino-3-carboxypropyl transferase
MEIMEGIIDQGKFEKYFHAFRTKILPLIHSKKRIDALFAPKSAEDQKVFFDQQWNTWRWRTLFKVFFSKFVMGKLGRDPEFLNEVKISVSQFILAQAAGNLRAKQCQDNYYLQYILKGQFITNLPHYAREENYTKIKSNIANITVFKGLAEDAFTEYEGFNKFNLSNIFEYMPPATFKKVSLNLQENSAPNSIFAYWNLMVPRRISAILPGFEHQKTTSEELGKLDHTFFYSQFVIDSKK